MTALGTIICGASDAACTANATLDNLQASIDRFASRALGYLKGDFSEEAQSFGAFCARVVLENSCAALVGRLDPFRLLYLAEFQAQAGYQYGRPSKSGFRWTGDVLADDKIKDLWSADHESAKISRALFSPHTDHVFWRPAVEKALDFIAAQSMPADLNLQGLDPDTFVNSTRGRCATLYSTLSKGVHWEFFVSTIIMDEATVRDAIRECLTCINNIGLVSHFVPTIYRPLNPKQALQAYVEVRKELS